MENIFNFDVSVDRHDTNSYKWDDPADTNDMIQLWVADMDFRVADPIVNALRRRVEHGVFGYTRVPDKFYEATRNWFATRHSWDIDTDRIIYTTGVVPAISAIIKAMTKPGDKVALLTPAYNCFFSSIRNNGCEAAEVRLKLINNRYEIDFEELERTLSMSETQLMLFCNPHNPAGRVWTKEELRQVSDLCTKHNVLIVSDEIHCELVFPGYRYTPFAIIAPDSVISCISPSKAFNIAGLQIAEIVCPDSAVQARVDRAINDNEVCDVNPFGVVALIAAYTEGMSWLEAVNSYIYDNYLMLRDFFKTHMPMLHVVDIEGTYLAWIDCRSLPLSSDEIERLGRAHGVRVASGSIYHGDGFIRINMATPRRHLLEGLQRLAIALGYNKI